MALPSGFLDELRSRVSITQVVGRVVSWDMRKSNAGRGDYWAPCPFHQEKTASFHVDERKGYYYCFGCQAKGDVIGFLRETGNMTFMEAVAQLAREAGMALPDRDPAAQARDDRRTRLAEVMEAAVRFYRLQLATAAGSEARAYLARRGLSPEAQARHGLGYAPAARTALWAHLTAAGTPREMILEAGLCAEPEGGGTPYDRFRDRILFPIRDLRGRAIALGGRAMDPNARAKYLNSPQTALFDKGRSLYNHAPAREAVGKGAALVVAEGYMDVIALVEAGFGGAVAPLGTAITEDQLQLIWRLHPEPVIALDGDKAGLRAAMRLIDLALPLIGAGRSLRFALLPAGQDPDDLIRAEGAGAMGALIEGALPLVDLLWRRETEGRTLDSPERRAALEQALKQAVERIADPALRRHYDQALRERLRALLRGPAPFSPRPARGTRPWRPGGWSPPPQPLADTRSSVVAGADAEATRHMREAVILATLIRVPALLAERPELLEDRAFRGAGHGAIAAALLRAQAAGQEGGLEGGALAAAIAADLGAGALDRLFAQAHVRLAPSVRDPSDLERARLCLDEELAKIEAQDRAAAALSEGMAEMAGEPDEGLSWRLDQAAQAARRAIRSPGGERVEFDIAENGARLDRAERDAFALLLRRLGPDGAGGRGKARGRPGRGAPGIGGAGSGDADPGETYPREADPEADGAPE